MNAHTACRQVCTVNPEFIVDAQRDPDFAAVLRQADLCVPDGVGILWAARVLGRPLTERVTGSDGIYLICERAAEKGWRVFLLGAAPGVAAAAADRLQARYPALQIAGVFGGSPAAHSWPSIEAPPAHGSARHSLCGLRSSAPGSLDRTASQPTAGGGGFGHRRRIRLCRRCEPPRAVVGTTAGAGVATSSAVRAMALAAYAQAAALCHAGLGQEIRTAIATIGRSAPAPTIP